MVSKVIGQIQEVVKDGRRGVEPRPAKAFSLMSPLVASPFKKDEEAKMCNVHPFWAVIRCVNSTSLHNMKLYLEEYVVPQSVFKGCLKPNRNTVITLPALRNIVALEKGDILTVALKRTAEDAE